MKKFHRRRGVISTRFSAYEVELLSSLVGQLIDLVTDGDPDSLTPPEDPFEQLVQGLAADPDQPETHEDPVLKRLFPNPYPHDDAASSDFRRYTERGLRTRKFVDAQLVLRDLAATELGSHEVRITPTDADAWLRTLTSVRLAVATRLDITDAESAEELAELPDDDPRAFLVSVYDWLGFAQETLISSL